jgi:hypothetical protein
MSVYADGPSSDEQPKHHFGSEVSGTAVPLPSTTSPATGRRYPRTWWACREGLWTGARGTMGVRLDLSVSRLVEDSEGRRMDRVERGAQSTGPSCIDICFGSLYVC